MGVKMTVLTGPNANPYNPNHNPIPKTLTLNLSLSLAIAISANPLPSGTGCKLWSVVVGSGRW